MEKITLTIDEITNTIMNIMKDETVLQNSNLILQDIYNKYSKTHSENNQLKQELSEMKLYTSSLEDVIRPNDNEIFNLNKKNSKLLDKINKLEKINNDIRTDNTGIIDGLKRYRKSAENEIEELNNNIKELKKNIKELKNQLNNEINKELKFEELQNKLNSKLNNELNNTNKQLNNEINELKKENKLQIIKLEELEKQLNNKLNEELNNKLNEELNNTNNHLINEIDELKIRNKQLLNEKDILIIKNEELSEQINISLIEINSLSKKNIVNSDELITTSDNYINLDDVINSNNNNNLNNNINSNINSNNNSNINSNNSNINSNINSNNSNNNSNINLENEIKQIGGIEIKLNDIELFERQYKPTKRTQQINETFFKLEKEKEKDNDPNKKIFGEQKTKYNDVSFSTDYMASLLCNETKLKPKRERTNKLNTIYDEINDDDDDNDSEIKLCDKIIKTTEKIKTNDIKPIQNIQQIQNENLKGGSPSKDDNLATLKTDMKPNKKMDIHIIDNVKKMLIGGEFTSITEQDINMNDTKKIHLIYNKKTKRINREKEKVNKLKNELN